MSHNKPVALMADRHPKYQKLPGKKKSFLMGIHRLWLAEDHLLQVHSRVGTEQYQRFYFKDIQALFTRKTVSGKIYNGLLAAIALLLLIPAVKLTGGGSIFFYCMAALFLIILLVNWLLGPTCRTLLKTAVQQERLPSLHRLKTATRVMNQLRQRIQAEQGILTREMMMRGLPHLQKRLQTPVGPSQARSRYAAGNPAISASRGRVHLFLVALLFARALLGLTEFYVSHMALTVVDLGIFLTLFVLAIIFLVRQYDPPRHTGMLVAAWSTVAYVALSAISGYAIFIGMAFKDPNAVFNQWKQIEQVARLSPNDNAVLMGLQLFFVVFAALLGIFIFIISRSQPAGSNAGTAAPRQNLQPGSNGRA